MKTRVTFDYPKIPEGRAMTVRALLKVEAESPAGRRRPLNIGVVLDRSGSMHGSKIEYVKQATQSLAERLGREDTFSLTIFDNVIETIVPPRKMGEGTGTLRSELDRIHPRSNTDLCGGYLEGCERVLSARGNEALDRVVLLTDGLANVGITDPVQIASLAGERADRGIVTSTIGVGADYSEHLLGRMAEAGGGNTYFLQSAVEVEEVLEEELGGLLSLAGEGLKVRFEPSVEGVRAEQLNAYRVASDGAWVLGDVYGNHAKVLVLELSIPAIPVRDRIRCGRLHLSCTLTSDGGRKEFTETLPIDLDVVLEKEFAAQTIDPEVTLRAVELKVAAARTKAWELANRGDFEGASKVLNDCAAALEKLGSADPAVAKQLEALRLEAERLTDERGGYYTPMMQKRMYTEAHYAGMAKFSHLGSMESRHGAYVVTSFPLFEKGGYWLVGMGDGRYLIDTGRPATFGDRSPLRIASRSFEVKPRVGSADAASVSRDIRARVTGVLGADLLGQFDVLLDFGAGMFAVDENCRPLPGKVVKADFSGGVPVLPAEIGGVPVRLLLSTGTRISFLKAGLSSRGDLAGRNVETLAGVGEFETEMRKVEIDLGGTSHAISVGTLPTALESTLASLGADGILGADFCVSKRIAMSARQGVVTIGSGRKAR